MPFKHVFFAVLLLIQHLSASSQIFINEILASNSTINTDPDYTSYADWIELYNAGETAVNLNGYFLTDNLENPQKWPITADISIPSKGFLLIWCDDNATGIHTNFKLSASGEEIGLYNASQVLIDSLVFGPQYTDISYARYPDGGATWMYYTTPSPISNNDSTGFAGQVDNTPEFMLKGGFYTAPVAVELFTDLGGTIRYTLDGSEPTEESTVYSEAIPISSTTIVRASIFKPGFIPSPVITNSYFINEDFENRPLPVVSIATDPDNFWDASKGIYVQSYKPDWEIPVNVELFENNGSDRAGFNERAGIKVNGLYSWELPQKMLGVYFRKQYGSSQLEYPLFFDRDRDTFDNLALRASGSDWSYTMFRDGFIQQACHNYNMNLDNMAFRPSIVYVNGEYLGIHNIREKVDEDYIVSNHGYSEGDFDLIENGDYVESGSLDAWNAYWTLVKKDLSIQANFDSVANYMDVENFSDLIITEVYDGNNSIDHNTMAWKPKTGGKWRWILMDLDRGFFEYDLYLLSFYSGQTVWPLADLLENDDYKAYLGTRMANHMYTTYNPLRIKPRIDKHASDIAAEMPRHIARWLGTTSDYGDAIPSIEYWNTEVADLKTYAEGRPIIILNDLQNYGFSAPAELSLAVNPSDAGTWLFNGMDIDQSDWYGHYPKNLAISLKAVNKPGYAFQGWTTSTKQDVIAKKSSWKYLDDGTNQDTAWYTSSYDDSSWDSGNGILGYGLSNITTNLSYGSNSSSKYVTSYFRKSFTLDETTRTSASFLINLLRDDGAVVYINGETIIRSNMPAGNFTYATLASSSINGTAETSYITYAVDPSVFVAGTNIIAVEVHQNTLSSSDLGFDLQLVAEIPDNTGYVSTSSTYDFTLTADKKLTAVYQKSEQSVVPDTIKENTTLYKALSPYLVQGDVFIPSTSTLTIEPGVVLLMPPAAKFMVNGSIQALGTASDSITFKLNPDYDSSNSWGALCFINAPDTTRMSYVTIRDASDGPKAYNCVAAISAFRANLKLDHMTLTDIDSNPIAARYSSIRLTNSNIHSDVLGDLVNIKYGKGYTENCQLTGNSNPDTDGIDYDEVPNGIIKNVRIHDFEGSNSDAVDIGEQAINVQIDSVLIYNITDKGISAGQRSTVFVKDATIINCTLGFGVKDSSDVSISNATFYGVCIPVASYEKNLGKAGGNIIVTNSILSNSYDQTLLCDTKSTLTISNSLSDNDSLPESQNNIFGNPGFNAPGYFDFALKTASPIRLGSGYYPEKPAPQLTISEIFFNGNNATDRSEIIGLYNPGESTIDISGYTLSEAVDFTFPANTFIEPEKRVYVIKDLSAIPEWTFSPNVLVWTDGSLANEGEAIRLSNASGMVIDQVCYSPDAPWPSVSGTDEKMLSLLSYDLDNHFAESWTTVSYDALINGLTKTPSNLFMACPNPTYGDLTIRLANKETNQLNIYSITGQLVFTSAVQDNQTIDLSHLAGQLVIARIGNQTIKIVILE